MKFLLKMNTNYLIQIINLLILDIKLIQQGPKITMIFQYKIVYTNKIIKLKSNIK